MVKNPISPDLELWIGAIERLYFAGIDKLVAIHRGFSTHEKTLYRNNPLWNLALQFRARLAHVPLICDPSHIAGKRELVPAVAQKAIDLGMNGLMIESHPCPTSAWTDAAQQLTPDALAELLSSLKWKPKPDSHEQDALDRLRAAIDRLDEEFVEIMAARMNLAREIGVFKKLNHLELYQPARWKEVLEKRKAQGTKLSLSEAFIEHLYERVHQESLRVQSEATGIPLTTPARQSQVK
jgi:chorismate mutase